MKLEKEPVDCKVINLEIPQEVSGIVMKAMAGNSMPVTKLSWTWSWI